jgi:hypothetical protein
VTDRLIIAKSRLAGFAAACAVSALVVLIAAIGPSIPSNRLIVWHQYDSIAWIAIGVPLCLLWMASLKYSELVLDRSTGTATFSSVSFTGQIHENCRLSDIGKILTQRTSGYFNGAMYDAVYFVLRDGRRMQASSKIWLKSPEPTARACVEFLGGGVEIERSILRV